MNRPDRSELVDLLRPAIGDRATELLMSELPDPDHADDHDGLDARIEGMRAHMDQQFAGVRDRFTEVEHRLENVETRLENVETRLENVETRLENVETRLIGVETSILVLTERIDTNYAKTEALVLREIGALRADMITQTRSLFIGIPSMIGAIAVFVFGLAQFTLTN
jgi:septal ring factor EnvC (AmiA/AmiB activator)